MFRLSKLTDYGIVILAELASHSARESAGGEPGASPSMNARELAEHVDLPLPVVSKVLKALTRAEILESQRGTKGGYSLARDPAELTVSAMIAALDGPLALTQCSEGTDVCELEATCSIKNPWQVINHVVQNALASITLADLTNPVFAAQHTPLATLVELERFDEARLSSEGS
ncbi:MAG: SUF system Fe-S cluster assembly regulator [Myxococcota bacterium]|nr:SUF system Fe-S cluster assembly regulator [Myxococcota bacterium]